jgi:glycosyltransferase involved in cell wall biosynthesis
MNDRVALAERSEPMTAPADGCLPAVSVVVPTRNRAAYLRGLLGALTAQVYPRDRMEVIVVDNDSSDATESVVREAATTAPFALRYIRKDDRGPAAARNLGAAKARGELLAFTDSDCLPSPAWLHHAVSTMQDTDGLVCGPIIPIPGPSGGDALLCHQMDQMSRDEGTYPTANVVYRRSAFVAATGFDETFGVFPWGAPVGGDDTLLGWRVRRAGKRAAFAPLAVVYHRSTRVTYAQALLANVRVQAVPRLLREIPELRETLLWRKYFLRPHTAAFYPLLAGVLLARRSRWALLLALPWVWRAGADSIGDDRWPPDRWWRLVARLGLQLQGAVIIAAVLAWSSVRFRRVVL